LLAEATRCLRIIEQFASGSLIEAADGGQETIDLTRVVREITDSLSSRFRLSTVVQTARLPKQRVLLASNLTTLSRLVADLWSAGLAFARDGYGQGQVTSTLQEVAGIVQLDFIAARGPEELPDDQLEELLELAMAEGSGTELWKSLETLNLAVLQTMARCLGGRLVADRRDSSLCIRLLLPASQTTMPLPAGRVAPYVATGQDRTTP
jgi:hypothetical protein